MFYLQWLVLNYVVLVLFYALFHIYFQGKLLKTYKRNMTEIKNLVDKIYNTLKKREE
ncbi:MAG: hypothetical protein JW885_02630 [Deltaproteobacteria bacterium]|nr:hypothetical protein [Candidatus Zymogenaceae bacterium]